MIQWWLCPFVLFGINYRTIKKKIINCKYKHYLLFSRYKQVSQLSHLDLEHNLYSRSPQIHVFSTPSTTGTTPAVQKDGNRFFSDVLSLFGIELQKSLRKKLKCYGIFWKLCSSRNILYVISITTFVFSNTTFVFSSTTFVILKRLLHACISQVKCIFVQLIAKYFFCTELWKMLIFHTINNKL